MIWSIEFLPAARQAIKDLDREQQRQVLAAVQKKLKAAPADYGDRLGKKGNRNLSGLFSLRVDGRNLRIIYMVFDGLVQVVFILAVADRQDHKVHDLAARILETHREDLDLAQRAARVDDKQFAVIMTALKAKAAVRNAKKQIG